MLLWITFATVGAVFGFNFGLLVAATLGARRRGTLAAEVDRLRASQADRCASPGRSAPAGAGRFPFPVRATVN